MNIINIIMNNIIQTPSHLALFEKDTNIKPSNIRESMKVNTDRKLLTQQFFGKNNQTILKDIIKKEVEIKSLNDEEYVNMIISNIFMDNTNNHNITITVKELNNIVITKGIQQIKNTLESQKKFISDRNNISIGLQNPIVTSNKIERQLPRSNFI